MAVQPNSQLSIVMPTYNRADFLDYSLSVHVPLAAKHSIQIFVFDNASTDSTSLVVEKWQSKYQFVHYFRNSKNIGAEANFELALKTPETDYVWLLGDTYEIGESLLLHVMTQLDEGLDHILVNVGDEVKLIPSKMYKDHEQVLTELFWLATCLSCHVFSRRLVKAAEFDRYQNSYFVHAGIFFDYIAKRDFRVLWVADYSVARVRSVGGAEKVTWMNKFFEVWVAARSNLIMSLPVTYSLNAKLSAIRAIEANGARFSVKRALMLRAEGILHTRRFWEYSQFLDLLCSRYVYWACYFISYLPVPLTRMSKQVYQRTCAYFRRD